jgi:hypothetical protein
LPFAAGRQYQSWKGAMPRRTPLLLFLLLSGLALAACGPRERPPPPYFEIPPEPLVTPSPDPAGGVPLPFPNRNPEVQYFLPGPSPDELTRGPAPVQEPGRSATPLYTPPYSGPVTGYGPGGMAQPPGAPPNPPYPPGGLTGPRF